MNSSTKYCLNCQAKLVHSFIKLGKTPIANNLPISTKKQPEYMLNAQICEKCYLVQVNPGVDPNDFFEEYSYQSGLSKIWQKHCDELAKKISKLNYNKKTLILEIASNDGTQLDFLKKNKYMNIYGVDPSKNLGKVNKKKGHKIFCDYFGNKFIKKFMSKIGRPEIIIANNVIAHIPDINDFCSSLYHILSDRGICIIEFHYLIELISKNAFDTIYHEHHFYHSLYVLNKILLKNNLKIFDFEKISTHGGSLRIFITKYVNHKINVKAKLLKQIDYELEKGIDNINFYKSFNKKIKVYKSKFEKSFSKILKSNKKIYGYGAAAKSCTFIHYMKIENHLQAVYDNNLYKQGKYIPNTGIRIKSPKEIIVDKPDVIIVFIWNLKDEIIKNLSFIKKWGGKIVFCLPDLEIIS